MGFPPILSSEIELKMIYQTAYDTSTSPAYPRAKIEHALKEATIRGLGFMDMHVPTGREITIKPVTGSGSGESQIPVFAHPLPVKTAYGETLFVDVRPCVTVNRQTQEPIVKNTTEYEFIRMRAMLNLIWLEGMYKQLRDLSTVPVAVYASMIAENMSRHFNLDPKEVMQVKILAAVFYQNLHSPAVRWDEQTRVRYEAVAMRAAHAPNEMAKDLIERIDHFDSIRDLCDTIKNLLENPRLEELNPALLMMMLGGAWFGANAREVMAVALEHPPTWHAVVYSALVNRSFKKTGVAQIAERFADRKGGDMYRHGLLNLLDVADTQ
jgi:hypothetical protein